MTDADARQLADAEAERATLGAILLEGDCFARIYRILHKSQFVHAAHQSIYECMSDLYEAGTPIDHITTIDRLRLRGELEAVGGPAYVIALTNNTPRGMNVEAYADRVCDAWKRRRAYEKLTAAARKTAEGNGDVSATITNLIADLQAVEHEKPQVFTPPAHWQLLDVAEVDNWDCEPLQWIVEDIVARGSLVFVAADTQCGKTLLGFYLSLHLLSGGKLFGRFQIFPINKLLYLLLEDPSRRAKERILDIRREMRIDPGRFMMYVAPGLTINDDLQFTWLREFIAREQFDLVVLDTYQKATPGVASFDDVKQGPILHRLSNLTRELNVTLWIHDHYRKETGGRKRRELDLSNLKGTGGKPQNADSYILMEREGKDTIKVLISGKDTDQKPRFALAVSPKGSGIEKFTWAGDLVEAASKSKQTGLENCQRVFEAIPVNGGQITSEDICTATGLSTRTVNGHLSTLIREARISTNGKGSRAIRYMRANSFAQDESAPCGNPVNETLPFN